MKNLSTSKLSGLQKTWSSLPWGTVLFLLAVFAFATPLIRTGSGVGRPDSALAMSQVLGLDNLVRIIALFLLGAFSLFNILRSKSWRFQINGLLGWLILFYLVWATLSIIWSINPRFTLKRVGILLLLAMGALYVAKRFSLQETIALVFFICAVYILGGTVHLITYNSFRPFVGHWRFGGIMHPIMQGWHLGLLLLSAFALSKKAEQNRAVYFGIAFIAFLLIILTRSRAPLAACLLGYAVFWSLSSSKRHQGVLFFLGTIIMLSLMYFILGYDFMYYGGQWTITLGRVGEIESATTLTGRTPLWKAAMILVEQRPFVGYGYEAFLTAENLFWITEKIGWTTPSAHSGYISTLGGLGYIGAVSLVLILLLSVIKSIGLARRNQEYAFVAAVLVWLIINMSTAESILTRPYFPVFVWMILLAKLGFIREES